MRERRSYMYERLTFSYGAKFLVKIDRIRVIHYKTMTMTPKNKGVTHNRRTCHNDSHGLVWLNKLTIVWLIHSVYVVRCTILMISWTRSRGRFTHNEKKTTPDTEYGRSYWSNTTCLSFEYSIAPNMRRDVELLTDTRRGERASEPAESATPATLATR